VKGPSFSMNKKAKAKDKYLKKKYKLSLEQYKALAKNGCHICGKKPKKDQRSLHVDHDHKSGLVRGVLCYYCNKYRLGRLDLKWAIAIYYYLKRHQSRLDSQPQKFHPRLARRRDLRQLQLDLEE
jgi:hypothetical protein